MQGVAYLSKGQDNVQSSANTITELIKDLLIRCDLPLSLCQGQAYDRAATMQGRRKGVATQIRDSNPAALPVHLCLGG